MDLAPASDVLMEEARSRLSALAGVEGRAVSPPKDGSTAGERGKTAR